MRTLAALFALLLLAPGAKAQDSLWITLTEEDGLLRIETNGDSARTITAPLVSQVSESGRYSLGDRFQVGGDTMYVGDLAISMHRLSSLDVERQGGRVQVRIHDRGPGAPPLVRTSQKIGTSDTLRIDSGQFVRGFVLAFGSHVEVEGEVNRSVVVVGGDVTVQPGGVVRGSVVALGGDVHKADLAYVYGDLYANNKQKFRPHWYEDPDDPPVDFSVALDYHRVSGGLVWAGAEAGPKSGWSPRLAVSAGYAFWPELWHYRIGLRRESTAGPLYYLGFHRDTKDDDAQIIGSHENTLFALLFGLDYRDYYFAQGISARAGWSLSERRRLQVSYVQEDLTYLDAHQEQWSLFNGGSFQRNYETHWRQDSTFLSDFDGKLAFIKTELAYQWPEYAMRREGTWNVALAFEVAARDLGSDFDYTRYGGRLERSQPTWRHQEVRARVAANASGGLLPATRTLYLGGPATLRGFDHKEFLGDRSWILNLEYGWVWENLEVFALYDAGQLDGAYPAPGVTVLHNVGLGVQIQRTLRVQVAVDARFERAPLVTFRFAKAP